MNSNGGSKSRPRTASTGKAANNGAGPYLIVSFLFVAMFLGLIAYLVYFNVVRKEEFLNSSYNTRQNNYAERVIRGTIYSADGQELAKTTTDENGDEVRTYPFGSLFAQVVGYTGKGNSGLESSYNYMLMESHTSKLKQVKNEFSDAKNPGDSLYTTLNTTLQQAAADALDGYRGAVVVLEAKTGRVLANVSNPVFNPNTIDEDWEALNADDESGVFLNRGLQGRYPPGSTFKIVTSLAYLRQNGTLDGFSFDCDGELTAGNYTIHCSGGEVHGPEDFAGAFAHSCNSAFAQIGLGLDKDAFRSLADSLYLNSRLDLELPTSKSSFDLDSTTADALVMQTSIGQGDTLVTPMEMALIASAVANDGEMIKPRYVDNIVSADGQAVKTFYKESLGTVMSESEANTLTELMKGVVQSGTAVSLSDLPYNIAGKTGTAEHGSDGETPHSWFVGFSNAEMDQFSTASLITRSTNDIQQIQMVSVMVLRMIAYAPILGIGGVLKVMKTGAGMEWIIVLAIIVILGYVMLLVSLAMPKFKLMQKLVDNINLVSREILTGLSVIRAFGREDKEEERFDGANKELTKTTLFTNRVMTFMMPGMMMIMNVLTVGIVWVGAHKIDAGTMQVGAMTAFITYAMMIVMSFLMLTMMSIMLPRAAVAAGRIDEVIQTESSIQDVKNPEQLEVHNGVVRFDHVNFRYPGAEEDVLHDIDFVAEPGKTTAIIGSTGCGKSTLVNLIPRLYDVTGGKITLDGKDIRNITMKDLRDEIGFVPQKGVLFSGTIASNLRFGKDDATDAEIEKAAAIAQATEFIEAKDDKYETAIAQGGTNVSGGQKQRLAIARAIAKDPKIFIFDDSFSALDLKTDAALRKALAENVKDSTVIIVAQRISTILHAEQILVLDDGKVVGKGTHEELLRSCEVYQEIAKSQLSEKELGLKESEVADHE